MLLSSFALAFAPAVTTTWPTDAAIVRVLTGPAGPRVVTAGSAIEIRDGAGILDARAELVATAVGVTDLYDDGTIELLACTNEGLFALSWTESGLGSPLTIETEPCTALTEVAGGFLVGGDVSRAWTVDGVRAELPFSVGAGAVMVESGGVVWATTPGGATLDSWDGVGVTSVETGGVVGGLTVVAGVVTWSLRDRGELVSDVGTVATLGDPAALAAADTDLSGVEDTIILHPARGSVGVLLPGASEEVEVADLGAPITLAAGLLDTDCPSVLVADGATLTRIDTTDCSPDLDADADDWSTGDGDCNDADATVHPGASEACNTVDDDCDGVVDELSSLVVSADDTAPSEGGATTFSVETDGCDTPELSFLVSGSREDDCVASTTGVDCAWNEDGDVTVTASGVTATGAAEDAVSITIANLPPDILPPDCGSDEWIVNVGDQVKRPIDVSDVELDPVSCYVVSGPPGLMIIDDCMISWDVTEADAGTWTVQLLAMDDDGGATLDDRTITVGDGGCGSTDSGCGGNANPRPDGCGCGGGASSALFALLLGGLARRRR